MFCYRCGNEVAAEQKNCVRCGAPLETGEDVARQDGTATSTQVVAPFAAPAITESTQSTSRSGLSRKSFWFAVTCAGLILIAAIVLVLTFFVFSNTRKASNKVAKARVELLQGNYKNAVQLCHEAVKLDPKSSEGFAVLSISENELGDESSPKADADKAVNLNPNDSTAYVSRGFAVSGSDPDKSLQDYQEAMKLDKSNVLAYAYKSFLEKAQKKYKDALASANMAIKVAPKSAFPYIVRAQVRMAMDEKDNALSDCDAALKYDPRSAFAYKMRTVVDAEQGNWDKAISDISKAIELEPSNVDLYLTRVDCYDNMKAYDKALADCNKSIALDPKSSDPYIKRGYVYLYFLNRTQDALADYLKAAEIDPTSATAYVDIADVYCKTNQYQPAIDAANKALSLDPKYAMAYGNRGVAYERLGQFAQALSDYQTALNLDPGNQDYLSNITSLNNMLLMQQAMDAQQQQMMLQQQMDMQNQMMQQQMDMQNQMMMQQQQTNIF